LSFGATANKTFALYENAAGANLFGFKFVSGAGTDRIAVIANATEWMSILNSGSIGLGTTAPGFAIDLAGDTRIRSTYYLYFGQTAVGDWTARMNVQSGVINVNCNGFVVNDVGYGGTKNYFTILGSTGYVGINTAAPSTPFQLIKATTVDGASRTTMSVLDDTAMAIGVGAGIALGGRYQDTSYVHYGIIQGVKENGNTGDYSGNLVFLVRKNGDVGPTVRAKITAGGSVITATAALATTATDGFLYIPTCAGVPTGVPTAQTGTVAMIYDTTNNRLYVYDAGWNIH
jgi:hypothetical protein